MWPSLPVANHIADIANWYFIASLVVGVVSTILIVWMAGVKEGYWERDRTESAERVASLVVQGDRLRKDTAEANARAMEAQLALEKFKAPRSLSAEQQDRIATKVRPFGSIPFDFAVQTDPESINLMEQISASLESAGWIRKPWKDGGVIFTPQGKPPAGIVSFSGLAIQIDVSKTAEWDWAASTLWKAIEAEGIAATAVRLNDKSENANAVHIKVGKKP